MIEYFILQFPVKIIIHIYYILKPNNYYSS